MIRRYRVGWLFTMCGAPIQDATVMVEDDRIVGIEETGIWHDAVDLSQWAVMPALVNAHTHLEFSNLKHPLGTQGMTFPQWITEVIRYRQGFGEDLAVEKAQAIRHGLKQCAEHGVGVVGEIATLPLMEVAYDRPDVQVVSMLEILGLDPERKEERFGQAREHAVYLWSHENVTAGLSPHAPYSAGMGIVDECVKLSRQYQLPLAMHLAESLEELELLEKGTGPFRMMLEHMGLFREEDFPGGKKPAEYIEHLAPAYRAMVVHGNYLSEPEIALLKKYQETMSVCYCPRTHAYFHHDRHPMEALLADGIRVVLGTDSRASSPDLDLWAELQHVAQTFPNIPAEQLLPMVTRDAAFALGLEGSFGTIDAGQKAMATAFHVGSDCPDVLSAMLAERPRLWNLGVGLTQLDLATA
ncbi:Aminodeoxyfutalosine deaminase [Bremerella volcania]|uniref:Aminodeoxyfutalosine deaminase n=1 Tax=Bremerella volcania TaxID=2527984 RepID=A0A518CBL2_9BACT|nr:amidohydrolase family protein [Bremerella volcania]QDU76600.1 Aminodeoxyfutalosine deaminase [Bremerella volcania]